MPILRLAIPSPLRAEFDYLPPVNMDEEQVDELKPGIRMRVPFGRRETIGYLLEIVPDSSVESSKLKTAIEILDTVPLISETMVALCGWAAAYYQHPVGEVMPTAFPPGLRKGQAHKPSGAPGWSLTAQGKGLPSGALGRSPKQAIALEILQQQGVTATTVFTENGISTAVLRMLQNKGLIQAELLKLALTTVEYHNPLTLNPDQSIIVELLKQKLDVFGAHLLEGVTGSGKTEVYLQLITKCLQLQQQVLVLVPEIGLTPQTLERFEARFSGSIVSLHSGLTDGARQRAWESARDGSAHIVLGTRSAVFTPIANLGLIVVDEEHDGSYKQQDGFRYCARDIAVKRAQLENCPVLLGSATPSLESIYNAREGRYQHYVLPERAGGSALPSIQPVDIRKQKLWGGLSSGVIESIGETLSKGQQALLFLNRRGYAPTLQCHDCGWIAECRSCDARLTVHRRRGKLRCHHCSASQYLPRQCPTCQSPSLMTAGVGTEQTEEFLRQQFSDWPIHRVDSDSMTGRDAMQLLVNEVMRGEPCILLGTQMLTKGHHFPAVSLVAILDVDSALFSTDFRGEERMAQLLTQVGGRAGRAEAPGQVILQTHYPDHPALLATVQMPYGEHARQMLEKRESAGMPPAGKLLMLRTDSVDAETGEHFLLSLRQQVEARLPTTTRLIGPLPSPMQRRAGKFRSQMLVITPNRQSAQYAAAELVKIAQTLPLRRGIKWSIDVDPLDTF